MEKTVTINNEQRLYVIPPGSGYSCYAFDVLARKTSALRKELGLSESQFPIGTVEAYNEYAETVALASKSGKRFACELHPRLIGLEGYRIECTLYDERVRFNVGKSTGFIPCHLQIPNSRSLGGCGISPDAELGHIQVIRKVR